MTHHGNAGVENLADGVDDLHPTLQLESVAVGLLHDADGVGDTFRGIHLIRTERHIANDQRTLGAAHNGFGVINHLVERHGQSGERTGHHIGGGVTHKNDVHAGAVHNAGHTVVISGQHGNLLALLLHLNKAMSGHFTRIVHQISCHSFEFFLQRYMNFGERANFLRSFLNKRQNNTIFAQNLI